MMSNFKVDWSSFRFTRLQLKSYVVDWIVLILFTALGAVGGLIKPFQTQFSVYDKSISYPHLPGQTFSDKVVVAISVSIPTLIIILWSLFQSSGRTLHNGLLSLLTGNALTLLFVRLCKAGVGRLRPDFLARCAPDMAKVNEVAGKLSDISVCTETNKRLIFDGQKSFFSGHAATAFASFMFLSLFLAGKLHVFDGKGHVTKLFIVMIPILAASYIAFTRLHDYRHHWEDIFVGSLVGSFFAILCYFQYFPSLFSNDPFPRQCRLTPSVSLDTTTPSTRYDSIPPAPKVSPPLSPLPKAS